MVLLEFWADDINTATIHGIDWSYLARFAQLTDTCLLTLSVGHGSRFVTLDQEIAPAYAPTALADQLMALGFG